MVGSWGAFGPTGSPRLVQRPSHAENRSRLYIQIDPTVTPAVVDLPSDNGSFLHDSWIRAPISMP